MYESIEDPYCYPGTTVLKNLANIRDPSDLERFEAISSNNERMKLYREGISPGITIAQFTAICFGMCMLGRNEDSADLTWYEKPWDVPHRSFTLPCRVQKNKDVKSAKPNDTNSLS
jgi:hypothetical protein